MRTPRAMIRRYLGPTDIVTEELSGLVMALTITLGAGLVVEESEQATRHLLFAILGCNFAWGFIDGLMYVLDSMLERSTKARLIRSLQQSRNDEEAVGVIAGDLDRVLKPLASPGERTHLYRDILSRLRGLDQPHTRVHRRDIRAGLSVWLLFFLTALPAVVPFLFIKDRELALRASNVILLGLLFRAGYNWAREVQASPFRFGLIFLLAGAVMVGVVMLFGG